VDSQSHYEFDDDIDPFAPDAPNASGGQETKAQPKLIFPNLEAFVADYLVHHFARPVQASAYDKEFTWCSSWWAHTEASSRLNALWRAWESLRLNETVGMADWWNNYADPTMNALFAAKGPFQGCTAEEHKPANPSLPVVPSPNGLFSAT
jgi:hypothetical protein